jgi:hypothetical protein
VVLLRLLQNKILASLEKTEIYPEKRTVKKDTPCCRIAAATGGVFMSIQYTKIEILTAEILKRKAKGETKREIA